MSAERLTVERLTFGYPGRVVGRDVSFAMAAGEVLCLLSAFEVGSHFRGKSLVQQGLVMVL